MNVIDLQNEINRLRDDLESARNERDKLLDERDDTIAQYEEDFEQRKLALEQSVREQVEDAKAPLQDEINTLRKELDWMNRAASGDPCGWRRKEEEDDKGMPKLTGRGGVSEDDENGNAETKVVTFVNDETGEVTTEIPRILQFSTQVQRIGEMEEIRSKLKKTQRKAKEVEGIRRKLEVKMNDSKREIATLTRVVRSWESTSVALKKIVQGYAAEMIQVEMKLQDAKCRLEQYETVFIHQRNNVDALCADMDVKLGTITEQKSRIKQLEERTAQLIANRDAALQRLHYLEQNISEEVATKVAPIHLDIANANALLMQEKSERIMEYIHLADLWPSGWSVPSILAKYRVCDDDVDAQKRQACALELEEKLVEKEGKKERGADRAAVKWMVAKGDNDKEHQYQVSERNDTHDEEQHFDNVKSNEELEQVHHDHSDDTSNSEVGAQSNSNVYIKNESDAARAVILYIKAWNSQHKDEKKLWYDMQTVEEIAAGKDGWKFTDDMVQHKSSSGTFLSSVNHGAQSHEGKLASKDIDCTELNSRETSLSLAELRKKIYHYSKSEIELQNDLSKVRHGLAINSRYLIELVEKRQRSEENDSSHIEDDDEECSDLTAQNMNGSIYDVDAENHEPTNPSSGGVHQRSEVEDDGINGTKQTNSMRADIDKGLDGNNLTADFEPRKVFPDGNVPNKTVRNLAAKAVWSGFKGQPLRSSSASGGIEDNNERWVASVFLGLNEKECFSEESPRGSCHSGGNSKFTTDREFTSNSFSEPDMDDISNNLLLSVKKPECVDVGSFLAKQSNLDDLMDIITFRQEENGRQLAQRDDTACAECKEGISENEGGENADTISTCSQAEILRSPTGKQATGLPFGSGGKDYYKEQHDKNQDSNQTHLCAASDISSNAISLISEEAALHDKIKNKIFGDGDKLKQTFIQDHAKSNSFLQVSIEESEKELKHLSVQIISMQKNIAGMEGKIRGLSIAAAKPKSPEAPPPLKIIPIPSNHCLEAERNDVPSENENDFLTQECFDCYLRKIRGIEKGDALLPPVKVITSSQKEVILCAIAEENEKLRTLHERKIQQYVRSTAVFQQEKEAYETCENERQKNLAASNNQLLLLEKKLSYLRDLKSAHEDERDRLNLEMNAEKKCWSSLQTVFDDVHTFKCKLWLEAQQGLNQVSSLQNQLNDSILQHKLALELPLASTSFIGQIELEKQRASAVANIERKVISIRCKLIEEGRRRRVLYEDELSLARRVVLLLREKRSQSEQKSLLAVVLKGLFSKKLTAMDHLHIATIESNDDVCNLPDGKNIDVDSNNDSNTGSVVTRARTEVDMVRHLLKTAQALGVISMNKNSVTNILKPIQTEGTWLPEAEGERLKGKVEYLESMLYQSTVALQNQVTAEKIKLGLLEEQNVSLKSRVERIERSKQSDLRIIQQMVDSSIQMLKERADDMAEAFQGKERIYRDKFACLTTEMRRSKNNLSNKIIELKKELSATSNIATAMRFELSSFHVKEDLTRLELERMKEIWLKDGGDLKEQLRTERQHSARLELMVAALKEQIYNHTSEIKAQEKLAQQKGEMFRLTIRKLKHELWRQHFAMYSMGMDVDSLFLFFVERLANLAGSKKSCNDALRANGAIEIAAVLCRGTREELRAQALKVLGGMCWNRCVERRLLGWDIILSWRMWTQRLVHSEELRIREIGKTLRDNVSIEKTIDEDTTSKLVRVSNEVRLSPKCLVLQRIRERRQWAMRKRKLRESPNRQNQVLLGSNKDLVVILLEISMASDKGMAKDALFALTATSFDENGADKLGSTCDFVSNILKLCHSKHKVISSQAAVLLGNLSSNNKKNQDFIGINGGVNVLMNLCKEQNLDLLEGASAALSNLVCSNPHNSRALIEMDGIKTLVDIITGTSMVNFFDENQNEEIQANLVECLANLAFSNSDVDEIYEEEAFDVKDLILLCGSQNPHVQKMAGIVMGNMARNPKFRYSIGMGGGVEALLLLGEKDDDFVKANSFWGLSNLAWEPSNQERVGRYIDQLLQACKSNCAPVQMHAMCCLANSLHYNEKNRERCNRGGDVIDLIHDTCKGDVPSTLMHSMLRMLVSLSYDDDIAIKLWGNDFILNLVKKGASADAITQRLSASILLNFSSHKNLKGKIVREGWIELLTSMQKSKCRDTKELSAFVLDELAGVTTSDEIRKTKQDIGIEGMIRLCRNDDLMVKKLALNSLAEEIWSNQEKQIEVVKLGGMEIILNICNDKATPDDLLVSALWAFQSITYSNTEVKSSFGNLKAVQTLMKVITNNREMHSTKTHVLECALTALKNLVMDHEKNCRDLLKEGLDIIINIAGRPEARPLGQVGYDSEETAPVHGVLVTLATTLLHIIKPYSYLICSNCGHKQPTGNVCKMCGRKIYILAEHKKRGRENSRGDSDDKENRMIKMPL